MFSSQCPPIRRRSLVFLQYCRASTIASKVSPIRELVGGTQVVKRASFRMIIGLLDLASPSAVPLLQQQLARLNGTVRSRGGRVGDLATD